MFKKALVLFMLIFLMQNVLAQKPGNESDKTYEKIGFSVLPFINGTFQLQFESLNESGNSVWLAPSVTYIDNDYDKIMGGGMEIKYRLYVFEKITEKNIKNIYFAPYGFYKHFVFEETHYYDYPYNYEEDYVPTTSDKKINVFGGGMLFGMQYVFAERVHIDFYIGGGLRKADKENYYDTVVEPGYSGLAPKLGIDLGFSF